MYKHYKLLISGITRNDKGLEIGPFFNPIAPKRDGWKTTVVDILPRRGLMKTIDTKTKLNHPTIGNYIEDVDIVWDWKNKSLEEEVINKRR